MACNRSQGHSSNCIIVYLPPNIALGLFFNNRTQMRVFFILPSKGRINYINPKGG